MHILEDNVEEDSLRSTAICEHTRSAHWENETGKSFVLDLLLALSCLA